MKYFSFLLFLDTCVYTKETSSILAHCSMTTTSSNDVHIWISHWGVNTIDWGPLACPITSDTIPLKAVSACSILLEYQPKRVTEAHCVYVFIRTVQLFTCNHSGSTVRWNEMQSEQYYATRKELTYSSGFFNLCVRMRSQIALLPSQNEALFKKTETNVHASYQSLK